MDLQRVLRARHSVRKFKDKKPDWREIIEAIDSARFSPAAGNNYTMKFILVSEKSKIDKLARICQQDFIKQAHYIVVACSKPNRLINSFGQAGKIYGRQQAGAAIQNFLLAITEKGLSTCWIGFFVESQIKKLLKIPKETDVEAVFPVGYEYERPKTKKAKIELDNILYFNEYNKKKMNEPNRLGA